MTVSSIPRLIPFFNYRAAFAADEAEYLAITRDVIRRGAFIQQTDLTQFEARLARYVGTEAALGVGNATDGLVMAFRALGVGAGDEVIVPSHTMVATAAAAVHAGALPVLVDMGPDHLIDPAAAEAAVTPRTRCVVPVHLNGRTCAMDRIQQIADRHGLLIVEDAAQGLGSSFRGQRAGSFGAAAAFSFYPAKILGCMGDGGAVTTSNAQAARTLHLLRDHGRNEVGDVEMWGFNSRLDNLQAAILDHQFKRYDTIIDRRRAVASRYNAQLGDLAELRLPAAPGADADHFDVFQNYEIEADRRDDLRTFLQGRGIGTTMQWGGKAVHQFRALGFRVSLPHTERFFTRCLMLPMNIMVSDEDVDYISETIRAFYLG